MPVTRLFIVLVTSSCLLVSVNIAHAASLDLYAFSTQKHAKLQASLDQHFQTKPISQYLKKNKLSITLVDITDIRQPKIAHINGTKTFYAASMSKLGILLAVFEEIQQGNIKFDDSIRSSLENMIRHSSNVDATKMYDLVGVERIEEILRSDRYRFYDEASGGGLWVGKPYGKNPAWKRDPIANVSHGASGLQVARFYYLLERNELADSKQCSVIKEILSDSAINHKFVKGLKMQRPKAKVYRKSGTWRNYHSDSALVERKDGRKYIAVAIAEAQEGGNLLEQIIVELDEIIDEY